MGCGAERFACGGRVDAICRWCPAGVRVVIADVGRNSRVLLAEDDAICASVVEALLATLGCDVVSVNDGHSALDALRTSRFDLVLIDGYLQDMDGVETVRQIRCTDGVSGQLAVVMLTGDADPAFRERALAAGASAVYLKPLWYDDLAGVLRTWVPQSLR